MNKISKKLKSSKGFSLVELVIVIGIIAILVAVVGAFIIRFIEKSKIQKDVANGTALAAAATAAANEPEIYREMMHSIGGGGSLTAEIKPGMDWGASYANHMGIFLTTVGRNYGPMPDFEYKKDNPTDWVVHLTPVNERLEVTVYIKSASGTFQVAPKPEGPYAK